MGIGSLVGSSVRQTPSQMTPSDQKLHEALTQLVRSPFADFDKIKGMDGVMASYLIYHKDKIIFAGSTNNLKARFTDMLLPKTTFILYQNLLKDIGSWRSVCLFLTKDCKYKVRQCESRKEAEDIEHLAAATYNPLHNKR